MQGLGPGADVFFPVEGAVNALVIFVQHLDDQFRDCRQLDDYDALGVPAFTTGLNYETSCAGNLDDNQPGGIQSWTEEPMTEWPASLPAGPDPNRTKQLPAWAESLIDSPGSTSFTPGSLSEFYHRMSNLIGVSSPKLASQ